MPLYANWIIHLNRFMRKVSRVKVSKVHLTSNQSYEDCSLEGSETLLKVLGWWKYLSSRVVFYTVPGVTERGVCPKLVWRCQNSTVKRKWLYQSRYGAFHFLLIDEEWVRQTGISHFSSNCLSLNSCHWLLRRPLFPVQYWKSDGWISLDVFIKC